MRPNSLAKHDSTVDIMIDRPTVRIDKLGQTLPEATDTALR